MNPRLLSTARALPPHFADQETLLARFRALWGQRHFNLERLEQLHRAVRVGGRHLALPLDDYDKLTTFAQRNDAWTRVAVDVGEAALRKALDRAQLGPEAIDHIFFVTVTGVATPSIDARLVNRMGLRADIKRTPIFGLGCVAGAAGLARASEAVRAFPDGISALVAVELCSLTLQREDLSIANIIASGLFGDGGAAVLIEGGARAERTRAISAQSKKSAHELPPRPSIISTRSAFYPDTERAMGWDVVDGGFKVVLSPQVPAIVREQIARDVDGFLGANGLSRKDVRHWICHSGGPKVLEAFEAALDLPKSALARSWASLQEVGNLSSASVLFVLDDILYPQPGSPTEGQPRAGDIGLLLAMGPGFCSELVLLRW